MNYPFAPFEVSTPHERPLLPRGKDDPSRFYLSEISLYNWGTFEKVVKFSITRKGFIFAGPSGSGKSTALDAHAALMTPYKWLNFNVAARTEKGEDRSLMSYVRGQWGNKSGDNSDLSKQFLRPDATWSSISETYQNDLGQVLTLVQVFWVKSKSCATADMNRRYFVFERHFALSEMEPYAISGFDKRTAETLWPNTACIETFDRYQEIFRTRLGILNEATLRLLHKTQSTKDMGDLNEFLRDFMLTEPETFGLSENLTKSFRELNAAYEAVKQAEKQLAILLPLRENSVLVKKLKEDVLGLSASSDALDPHVLQIKIALQTAQEKLLIESIEAATINVQMATETYRLATNRWDDLRVEHGNVGGGEMLRLENQIKDARSQQAVKGLRLNDFKLMCTAIDAEFQKTPDSFIAIQSAANKKIIDAQADSIRNKAGRDDLVVQKSQNEKKMFEVRSELKSLSLQKSNLPYDPLRIRNEMASELNLDISRLPFGGEMVQVKSTEKVWQGAIERLLGAFGVTLFVMPEDLPSVRKWINGRNLGLKFSFTDMRPQSFGSSLSARSAVHKLEFEKGPHEEWFREQLKTTAQHECVGSEAELQNLSHGLTKEGLIKTSRTSYMKNDRFDVNNVKYWVLGFSNKEKVQRFEKEFLDLTDEFGKIAAAIGRIDSQDSNERTVLASCNALAALQWDDIDVGTCIEQIRSNEERLAQLKGEQPDLQLMLENIAKAALEKDAAMKTQSIQSAGLSLASAKLTDVQKIIQDMREKHGAKLEMIFSEPVLVHLNELFKNAMENTEVLEIDLSSVDAIARSVSTVLNSQRRDLDKKQTTAEHIMITAMNKFIENWGVETKDLDASLLSVPEFIVKLEKLEQDNLPKFIAKFDKLLREQSDQHLTKLMRQIRMESISQADRISQVNEALAKTEFNKGTFLSLESKDRSLPDVNEFKLAAREILEQAVGQERSSDEQRFHKLKQLVGRLDSKEPHDLRWQKLVLDVRHHNNFLAKEKDVNGVEIQTYGNSAGKSGGERQKLTLTILAAALRYQLGGEDGEFPMYSTITVDEAFDKADPEFTKTTMRIFESCGFQLVVATPLKAVIALDEFVDGAVYIHMGDNHVSQCKPIDYDKVGKRLVLDKKVFTEEALSLD